MKHILINLPKFINVLISTDIKFLFIFNDITVLYINIFKFVKNYLLNKWDIISKEKGFKEKNNKMGLLSNYIYDISLLVLEGFKFLVDNKRNFEERFHFINNIKYDLSEELPNSKQIKDLLKELNEFLPIEI